MAVDHPIALAVPKGRNGASGKEQDTVPAHLCHDPQSQDIPLKPCAKQSMVIERRGCGHVASKLLEDRTEFVFSALKHWSQHHSPGLSEEGPPRAPCLREPIRAVVLRVEMLPAQQ